MSSTRMAFRQSLPVDVQAAILRTIPGLKQAKILKPGYAVEVCLFPPRQLHNSLETKLVQGLYHTGQINGTSGYEEAGAQGIMAGINAALKLRGDAPLVLDRSQAYIGVLIDDLITKDAESPTGCSPPARNTACCCGTTMRIFA